MKLLKREYFNQWYRLSSYYAAMVSAKLPSMFVLAIIYLSIVYLMSSQPLEWFRFVMLFTISLLTALTSDSFGLLVSSRLSLVVSISFKKKCNVVSISLIFRMECLWDLLLQCP